MSEAATEMAQEKSDGADWVERRIRYHAEDLGVPIETIARRWDSNTLGWRFSLTAKGIKDSLFLTMDQIDDAPTSPEVASQVDGRIWSFLVARYTKEGWIALIRKNLIPAPGQSRGQHMGEYHPRDGLEFFVGWKGERIGSRRIANTYVDYEQHLKIEGFDWEEKIPWSEIEYLEFKYSKPPVSLQSETSGVRTL